MISNSSVFICSFIFAIVGCYFLLFLTQPPQHLSRLGGPSHGRVLNFGPFIASRVFQYESSVTYSRVANDLEKDGADR